MNTYKHKSGLTLVEMIIVVAVIAILASMVVAVATRIDNKAKEQLTISTMEIIDSALTQFADYNYRYKGINYKDSDFPIDCNGFDVASFEDELRIALNLNVDIIGFDQNGNQLNPDVNPEYSGCEILYFLLNRVPQCKETLSEIDSSSLTSQGKSGGVNISRAVMVGGKQYPLLRILDGWGKTLRYDYYIDFADYVRIAGEGNQYNWGNYLVDRAKDTYSRRTFPITISAGPDGVFDTADDIKSR